MKKGIIVLIMVAGLVAPTFASDFTFGGDLTFGAIWDLTNDTTGTTMTATADIKSAVDDYNSVTVSIKSSSEDILLERAELDTKLGDYFMMDSGVGITSYVGYMDLNDKSYVSTSTVGNENVANSGVGVSWMMGLDVDLMGYATLRAAFDPMTENDFFVGLFTSQSMGDASFAAEVFFDGNKAASASDGNVIADGEFKLTAGDIALDVGLGIRYEMAAGAGLNWGAGVGFDYGTLFGLDAGIDGNPDGLNKVSIGVAVDPIDLIDLRAAITLSLASGTEMFQGADVAAIFNVGAVDIYAGYLVTSVGGGKKWAPAAAADGGPYLKFDINY